MDLVRRNTDYALRAMAYLAGHHGDGPVSAREVSQKGDIPYQLACKLLQKLNRTKLVESCMGPKGGFRISKALSKINLLEIIEAIQGKVQLSRCLLGEDICPHQKSCKVRTKLAKLEKTINNYLGSVTLEKVVRQKEPKIKRRLAKRRKNDKADLLRI
jgi:Rrf2 family iron-sulfur cluster assembly transcriptional regulator